MEVPFLEDVLVAIIVAAISVFIFSEENIDKKIYQKKYIINLYLLMGLFVFLNIEIHTVATIIIIIMLMTIINLFYNSDNLEKELNFFQLFIYKLAQMIFNLKFYYIYILLVIGYLFENKAGFTNWELPIITIISFLHMYQNSMDKFGVIRFEETKKRLEINEIELSEYYYEGIQLVKFFEDIGFDYRNKFTPSISLFLKRKFERIRTKRIISKKKVVHNLQRMKVLRGYSTISQQIIRRSCMAPDSYQYKIRRKIFVEFIYTKYYFLALVKQKRRYDRKNEKNQILIDIKSDLLKYYWLKILNNPSSEEELFQAMRAESGVSIETYREKSKSCRLF